MKRTVFALIALLLGATGSLRADQTTSEVQQALKDQGFYYGDITGVKNSDTTAAIRRYQIRNGLQITGEIDAETLRSLGVTAGASRSQAQATPAPAPAPEPEESNQSDEAPTQSAEVTPPPSQNYPGAPNYPAPPGNYPNGPGGYPPPRGPVTGGMPYQPGPSAGSMSPIFAGTPYEIAPVDVQRHVIIGAQTILTRYGLYRSGIDGQFGPGTAAALRLFQARARLFPDGRLNMQTLAALGLLPGQRSPGFVAPPRPFFGRPVYQGQVIPPG